MAVHLQPMSSRERASVLAVSIAVLVWIGAFGCISVPFAEHARLNRELERRRIVYEGMSLKEFRRSFPQATHVGHRVIDGVRVDGWLVEESYQKSPEFTRHQWTSWYYFHEDRFVLCCNYEAWNRAAKEVIEQRRQQDAEARRVAPVGDSR